VKRRSAQRGVVLVSGLTGAKGPAGIAKDHPDARPRHVVSLERHARRTDDGITILGVADFCRRLWSEPSAMLMPPQGGRPSQDR
jgi:hypothetical protein